jgi:hypothetical protein
LRIRLAGAKNFWVENRVNHSLSLISRS